MTRSVFHLHFLEECHTAMTTVYDKMCAKLVSLGLDEHHAREVLKRAKTDEAGRDMWDKSAEAYPALLLNFLWLNIRAVAKETIAEKWPEAWFRSVFD
jgi:hypothetical protein